MRALIGLLILTVITAPISFCAVGGCGSSKVICFDGNSDCHEFEEVGLINGEKDPRVKYETNFANVILGVVLSETLLTPVLAFGWWLWEPVGINPTFTPPAS